VDVSEDRRLAVLRAIVQDYVDTHEPVGSRALVDRHGLGVSPATVRNDMAVLEDEGYIAQPHTSAGRVPTEQGYRLFVDRLAEVKALSPAERRAISSFLSEGFDLDDVVDRTVRLLAQLTKQVAIVQYPSLPRTTIRHVELVALTPARIMLVVIASSGRVEQRVVDIPLPLGEGDLADVRARLNTAVQGRRFADVADEVADLHESFGPEVAPSVLGIVATLLETVAESREERVVVAGAANLTRIPSDFPLSVQPVLEALEEHVVLLRLLGETGSDRPLVRIGHENPVEELSSTSVVATSYAVDGNPVASLGVMGPTRMDYAANMASVQAVARYLGRILAAR
jgi:heat-inducible transcriptional repressor